MIKNLLFALLAVFAINGLAQDKSKRPSPPAQVSATINNTTVTIDYSQPSLKGRYFGSNDFHPYGKLWRNGANEATWIQVSDEVTINGKTLPKGKYGFFVIPGKTEWTLIFNSVWDQWGSYNYDQGKDVLRVTATSNNIDSTFEKYTIQLASDGEASLSWGSFQVRFDIQ
jgi:hypothetical protein